MSVLNIIEKSRRLCNSNNSQYTDDSGLSDINDLYLEVCNAIITDVSEDFFWDYIKTDTVIGQREYNISTSGITTSYDINKIKNVGIKYSTDDTKYKKAKFIDFDTFEEHRDSIDANTSNPFYSIKDKSIFIFPTPTEVVTDGIDIEVITTPLNLTLTSTQADIKIPREYHNKVLGTGLQEYIYRGQEKINEARDARSNFEIELRSMLSNLKGRNQQVIEEENLNLDYLS